MTDASALIAAKPEERASLVKGLVSKARAEIADRLAAGDGGRELTVRFAGALDRIVVALYRAALADGGAGPSEPLALVATGGHGRRETCPWSDVDLLFLTAGPPGEEARGVAERILYPLWDAGVDAGHSVRSVEEAVGLSASDLATATALLDARHLAGDAQLVSDLSSRLAGALALVADPNVFVRRLIDEKARRHERFAGSLYLLEPNLKQGRGTLRDLALGTWAARARWRAGDLADLVTRGQATARQVQTLISARDFVLRLRVAAHLEAGRRQDQLTFELQHALAPRFFPDARVREGELRPAVAPAVEELMRQYFLHARAATQEVDRLLERAIVPPQRAPMVRQLDASFVVWSGQLSTTGPEVFRTRPSEMVRLFRVALEHDLPIYGHTRDLVAELVVTDGARLGADPEARRHFVELLADPRDTRDPSLLEVMHDLGILNALMPEFAPCTGRVQHDLYHVFTVDQHQLYAVAALKRIARGELAAAPHPAAEASRGVERRAALYLGTLLHDVGKPLGKGHSETGARLALAVARRLGLSEADVAQVEFLVRHHLLLSHLSQRRDLTDVAMIAGLAAQLRDEETLRELYLLTYCDTAMTSPGNLSDWKERLLRQIYERTLAYLRRGPDLAGADRSALVRRRRGRVAQLVGEAEDSTPISGWFAGLPDRYFASLEPKAIVRHLKLSRARGERPLVLQVTPHPRKQYSELAIVAADSPGLLARITGVLLAQRIDVLGAQIHSRSPVDTGSVGEALDLFLVRDSAGRAIVASDPRVARLADELVSALSGEVPVETVAARGRAPGRLKARVTPEVPTEIEVDNQVAEDFTVVDVYTQDRPGVLHAITRTLTDLGFDIFLSKVATEASRVADVFYVRDRATGEKVLDAERLGSLDRALRDALGSL